IEVVEQLHQMTIPMGVVTSNTTANATAFLEKYAVLDCFEFVKGSKRTKKKHKKLRKVLRNYPDIPTEHILYIGDEVRDIAACRKVNIQCGAVTWGQASRQLLEQHTPDVFFDAPAQILDFVQQVNRQS
ncbi:MAG: HAD-IA family hydrolase, partial [Bacteroidota bacterium]